MSVGSNVPSPFRFHGTELMSCKRSMSKRPLIVYLLIDRALATVVCVATICSPLSGSCHCHKPVMKLGSHFVRLCLPCNL